jgi:hypothetical protein
MYSIKVKVKVYSIKFAQLEALVTTMVAQVKSNAYRLGKVKDQKDG